MYGDDLREVLGDSERLAKLISDSVERREEFRGIISAENLTDVKKGIAFYLLTRIEENSKFMVEILYESIAISDEKEIRVGEILSGMNRE